jgi:CheY-like chemotaxis protein
LLVEDEPTIRFVAQRQFSALGYPIADVAEDGLTAVSKALSGDFDIIFMDVRLPELDGISATVRIREAGSKSVIIGMTAFSHKEQCLGAGMDDFLQKPVMLQALSDALARWVAGRQANVKIGITDISGPEKFEQTAAELADLKLRIDELRRRSGL